MSELPIDKPGNALKAWLSQTPEKALEPGQPIIDPHPHLWDRRPRPELPDGSRQHLRYLADDLLEDIRDGGHNVFNTVFVECRSMYRANNDAFDPVGETEFVQGVAAMASSNLYGESMRCCGAIVSFADLTQGAEVEPLLRAHIAASPNFRGIRHAHTWHASKEIPNSHHPTHEISNLLSRNDFRDGFRVVDQLGLTFDCWGYHTQLHEVEELARTFPNTTIIVDHIGGPVAMGPLAKQRDSEVFKDWGIALQSLAHCPNIYIKVGGFGMPSYGWGYADAASPPNSQTMANAWLPYVKTLIEAFGVDRLMFESNFPVDKVSCSYTTLWNAFKRITADLGLSDTEKNEMFYGSAARAYRIPIGDQLQKALTKTSLPVTSRYKHALDLLECFQEARYEDMLGFFSPNAITIQHLGPYAGKENLVTEKTVAFMKKHNPPCSYTNRRQIFAHDRLVEQHTVTWPSIPDRSGQSIETVIIFYLDNQGKVRRLEEYGDPATL